MATDVAKDLIFGTVGVTSLLIYGHPFDTIKVKLQSQSLPLPGQQPCYDSAMDAVKQTIAKEGLRGLYKGMGAPMATVAACNAVLFTARGQMEALFRVKPGFTLSVGQQVVCGAGAGIALSFLTCPTELIKCRLQAQSLATASVATMGVTGMATFVKQNGPIDVAKHVLRSEGAKGLCKGFMPTLFRDVPGNGLAFGVYEGLKQFMTGGHDTSQLGMGALLASGGITGAVCWAIIYPTDVVKSVIQIDEFHQPKYAGTVDAFKKIATSEGFKGLVQPWSEVFLPMQHAFLLMRLLGPFWDDGNFQSNSAIFTVV